MNLLQLVLKQMRQRTLSTTLTILSVVLGVALAIGVLILQREGDKLFGQADFGYTVVVGPKGDPLSIVLNNAFGLGNPTSTMRWEAVRRLREDGLAQMVTPIAYGDTFQGRRVIAAEPDFFFGFEPVAGKPMFVAEGSSFHPEKFEAVIGSDVPMAIGDTFQPTHGGGENPEAHAHDETWTVVGIASETGTVFDRKIYISLKSFFAVPDHGKALAEQARMIGDGSNDDQADQDHDHAGHDHGTHDHGVHSAGHEGHDHPATYHPRSDGTFELLVPESVWKVNAAFVSASGTDALRIAWRTNNGELATAAFPGVEMKRLFDEILTAPGWVLFGVSVLVVLVAGISILVSIYNSVVARRREVAILRALGATRGKVLAILCVEATLIGLIGASIGLVLGKSLAATADVAITSAFGRGIDAWTVSGGEIGFVLGVVALAAIAGIVPALAAYRTPVADHLSSE